MGGKAGWHRVWVVLGVVFFLLVTRVVACSSDEQCTSDGDCTKYGRGSVCTNNLCSRAGENTPKPPPSSSSSSSAQPASGPLAKITISPETTSVTTGSTVQFNAVGVDSAGITVSPAPTFTWTVSGGGTILPVGLFRAGSTVGGPFTVTATSGSISGTATVTITAGLVPPPKTINIGETNILNTDDSGNADFLLAQEATLAEAATIKTLTFFIVNAAGNVRFGIYDATGPNNGPGAKKAETAEFVAAAGWNAVNVITEVVLPAGNYWLAYLPSDNDLSFRKAGDGTGKIAFFSQPYGALPATFSTTPTNAAEHWSFYATLTAPQK